MANKWTIFVSKYAKKHNISYSRAFNSAKAREEYNKYKSTIEKGGTKVKFRGKMYLVRTNKKVVDLSTNKEADLTYNQEGGVLEEPANVVVNKKVVNKKTRKRYYNT